MIFQWREIQLRNPFQKLVGGTSKAVEERNCIMCAKKRGHLVALKYDKHHNWLQCPICSNVEARNMNEKWWWTHCPKCDKTGLINEKQNQSKEKVHCKWCGHKYLKLQ